MNNKNIQNNKAKANNIEPPINKNEDIIKDKKDDIIKDKPNNNIIKDNKVNIIKNNPNNTIVEIKKDNVIKDNLNNNIIEDKKDDIMKDKPDNNIIENKKKNLISIDSIKSSTKKTKKPIISKNKESLEENKKTNSDLTDEVLVKVENKKKEINKNWIISKNETEENTTGKKESSNNKENNLINKGKIKEDTNSKELFTNYKTDYKEEKKSILEQIKNLKNLPKTNYKLLSWLVIATALWIWLLFYIDPSDHSLQNYKASIYNTIRKEEIEKQRQEITDRYNQLQEELKWKTENIKYLWFSFTVEYRTINWVKSYKYNDAEYSTRKDLDKVLTFEVEKIKKWIIKNTLINSFKE